MGKKIRGTFTVMVTAFDADNGPMGLSHSRIGRCDRG